MFWLKDEAVKEQAKKVFKEQFLPPTVAALEKRIARNDCPDGWICGSKVGKEKGEEYRYVIVSEKTCYVLELLIVQYGAVQSMWCEGEKFRVSVQNGNFSEKPFADCVGTLNYYVGVATMLQRKLSWMVLTLRTTRKFSPSKVFHYTVFCKTNFDFFVMYSEKLGASIYLFDV